MYRASHINAHLRILFLGTTFPLYKEMECTYIYYTYVFESDNWLVHVQSRYTKILNLTIITLRKSPDWGGFWVASSWRLKQTATKLPGIQVERGPKGHI